MDPGGGLFKCILVWLGSAHPVLSVPWKGTLFKCTLIWLDSAHPVLSVPWERHPVLSVPWTGQIQRTLFKCSLGTAPCFKCSLVNR